MFSFFIGSFFTKTNLASLIGILGYFVSYLPFILVMSLKYELNFFWVGFYIVKKDVLKLGPFQGTVACMEIQKGKGVCGTAWEQQTVQIIADVDKFPGHIACSNASKSEIVLPVLKNKKVVAVLDIDSDVYNDFDEVDQKKLTELCQWLSNYF